MSTAFSRNSECASSLTLSMDHSLIGDDTDIFFKKLAFLKKEIECKGEIICRKKEDYQSFSNYQMKKIDEEEKECNEKLEILTVKIKKCNNELNVLNNKYTQLQAKMQWELKKNEELKERLVKLQSDKKKQGESFDKTCNLYSNAISKYTDYLGIKADFDENDNKIINIYLVNDSEGFHEYPNMIIESINKNNNTFKVKKLDNHIEDDLIYKKSFKRFQITQLLSKLQNSLNFTC